MTIEVDHLMRAALELSVEERAQLAIDLIRSIDEGDGEAHSSTWDDEIERRVQQIRDQQVEGVPADDVFARLRAKHR